MATTVDDPSVDALIMRIEQAYHDQARALLPRLGPDLPSAILALAAYHEARFALLNDEAHEPVTRLSYLIHHLSDIFAFAISLAVRHARPVADSPLPAVSIATLSAAQEFLALASDFHSFQDVMLQLRGGHMQARIEEGRLVFEDVSDLAFGALSQAAAESERLAEANKRRIGSEAFRRDFEAAVETRKLDRQRGHILERIAAERRQRPSGHTPSAQPNASPLDWVNAFYQIDLIGTLYLNYATYLHNVGLWSRQFMAVSDELGNLPEIPEGTLFKATRWADIKAALFTLQGLYYHHLRLAKDQSKTVDGDPILAAAQPGIELPGPIEATTTFTVSTQEMIDCICFTTRDTLAELLQRTAGLDKTAARQVLTALIVPLTPGASIPASTIRSGLLKLGPSRILVVPSLGLWTGDSSDMLPALRALDPVAYDRSFSQAMGRAPRKFAALLGGAAELVIRVDHPLREAGRTLGDLDLGIYDRRHHLLICFEFKTLPLQDIRRLAASEETLRKAVEQLARMTAFFRKDGGAPFARTFGLRPGESGPPEILPVIVTHRTYGRRRYQDIPVITHVALARLLQEAEGDMRRFEHLLRAHDVVGQAKTRVEAGRSVMTIGALQWDAASFSL